MTTPKGLYFNLWLVVLATGMFASEPFKKAMPSESPDKKWNAQIADNEVLIGDSLGGEVPFAVAVLTPILEINWLPDSSGLLIVEHIAHGSQVALITREGRGWKRTEVAPTEEAIVYSVVNYRTTNNGVEVTYKITPRAPNGLYGHSWSVRIRYDLNKKRLISMEKL